ncbi:MAG: hypothetical protein ACXVCR_11750 [Bdellovibrio sp.]
MRMKKTISNWQITLVSFLLFSEQVWSRAGGGGGGHSSGGGSHSFGGGGGSYSFHSGGGSYSNSYGSGSGLDPIILIIILIVVFWLIIKLGNMKQNPNSTDIDFNPENTPTKDVDLSVLGNETQAFYDKAFTAFHIIQQAWSEKRLDTMRRFISDGVYQRFNAQFTMMNLLTQTNVISDVRVLGMRVVKSYHDGGYDCLDVRIDASANDQFVCEKYPKLKSPGGLERFVEFWSFIRRSDYKKNQDIFHSENCPQCSAALSGKLVETARCPYCGTYLNSGEYDWVLAEITQEDNYRYNFVEMYQPPQLDYTPKEKILEVYPSFSRQVLEDRASNALMQVLISTSTRNLSMLKRFTTPAAFEKFEREFPADQFVYDRLYTGAVDLLGVHLQGNQMRAYIGIQYNAHQILLQRAAFATGDETPIAFTTVVVLLKELSEITAKGSVYANSCPTCGAPQKDNLLAVCQYCNSQLNDQKLDWVVEDMMTMQKFRSLQFKSEA